MPCDTGFAIAVLFSRTMRLSDHRRAGTRHATTTPLTTPHARTKRVTTPPAQTWHVPRIVRWSRHAVRNHRYSVHSRVLRMISPHVPISACSKMSRLPSSSPCSLCYPMSSMLPALSFLLLLIPSHSSYPQVLPSYPCPPMTRGAMPNIPALAACCSKSALPHDRKRRHPRYQGRCALIMPAVQGHHCHHCHCKA